MIREIDDLSIVKPDGAFYTFINISKLKPYFEDVDSLSVEVCNILLDKYRLAVVPGLAFGLDRLVAILGGQETIRDFIAFPKNNSGRDVMIDAPAPIDDEQLNELSLKLNLK
jgi:aspartate/methionine/tyrosine aminotransferase